MTADVSRDSRTILTFLAALPPSSWYSTLGVAAVVAPDDVQGSARRVDAAMRLLFDAGHTEGQWVEGCAVWRATDAGRRDVVASAEPGGTS